MMDQVVVIGPVGVGKSVLLRRLRGDPFQADAVWPPALFPTIGVEYADVLGDVGVTLQELGGCMAPVWRDYYGDCVAVVFVVDASNGSQTASAATELWALLENKEADAKPLLVVLNKADVCDSDGLAQCRQLLRLDELSTNRPLHIVECSMLKRSDTTGEQAILQWLKLRVCKK